MLFPILKYIPWPSVNLKYHRILITAAICYFFLWRGGVGGCYKQKWIIRSGVDIYLPLCVMDKLVSWQVVDISVSKRIFLFIPNLRFTSMGVALSLHSSFQFVSTNQVVYFLWKTTIPRFGELAAKEVSQISLVLFIFNVTPYSFFCLSISSFWSPVMMSSA